MSETRQHVRITIASIDPLVPEVFVDDKKIGNLRSINFKAGPQEVPVLELELLTLDGFEFEGDTQVVVTVPEGHDG